VGDVAVGLEEMLEEEDGAAEFDPGLEGVEGEGTLEARGKVPAIGLDGRWGLGWGFEGWGRSGHLRLGERWLKQATAKLHCVQDNDLKQQRRRETSNDVKQATT
jgi:hypothetical protein